jgi:hypothetical protein
MTSKFDTVFTPLDQPTLTGFEYPFSCIEDESMLYSIQDMTKGFVDEDPVDAGNFPANITDVYWIHEGENDGDAWECLCKLENGLYAYYRASCDYTGFDCQGMMELHLTRIPLKLYDFLGDFKLTKIVEEKALH